MPHAGQELHGPGGYVLRLVETGTDRLEMEAHYPGAGDFPPAHLRPSQDEAFEVLDGAVRAVVDGTEHRYTTGQRFEIPAGTVHQMTGDGPARVRWVVAPALRTAEFFERLYGGALTEDPEAAVRFLEEFTPEVSYVPPA